MNTEEEDRDDDVGTTKKQTTFLSLERCILSLLLRSFDHETDATNIQLLLCGLLTIIQDRVTYDNMCVKTEATAKDTADMEVSMINQQSDNASESINNLTRMMNITSDSYFPSTFKSQENLLLYSGKDSLG